MNNEKNQESQHSSQGEQVRKLVLVNDNKNSFDHVIDILIASCNQAPDQAEQCATLTHYRGRTVIKTGTIAELEPIMADMIGQGLDVEIE